MAVDDNIEFGTNRAGIVFDTPSTRANIESGEVMPTILGKIRKFFTDLKPVAFSGSYNDLSDKVTLSSLGAAAASHTHLYAASTTAGGAATSAAKLTTATAGSATQPVYFTGGIPKACTYTLGKSVPSNAVFTDTNTWRGVQNNLDSSSSTDSLSAYMGNVLDKNKARMVCQTWGTSMQLDYGHHGIQGLIVCDWSSVYMIWIAGTWGSLDANRKVIYGDDLLNMSYNNSNNILYISTKSGGYAGITYIGR